MINERVLKNQPDHDFSLDACRVIDQCQDYAEETTQLEEIFQSRGHILAFSVKCHPEMAGCGIEYCWGKLKLDLRRNNSRGEDTLSVAKGGKTMEVKLSALIPKSLPLYRVLRFERKARFYRRMYVQLKAQHLSQLSRDSSIKQEELSYTELEKMMKLQRSHRNIVELDRKYIESV